MVYQDKYTWSHRLGDHCIAHHDGAVSLMLSWDGVDFELADDSGCNLIIGPLLSFLHNLDHRFFYEVHGWRDADSTSVDDYLSLNDKHIRGGDIAKHMRQSLADHVRPIARTNDTALVVTIPPFKSPLGFLSSSKRLLINQSKNAAKLLEQAKTIISFLSGAQLLSNVAYEQYILRSSNRDLFLYGNFKPDPTVFLNHQLASKPEIKDGFLYRDGLYHAVLFMPFYPDARPGWILNYSTYPIDMHISQTIRPLHHETARKQSQTSERLSGEGTTSNDKEGASKKASQERFFRQQMTDHNYNSISNCYCIHIHNESLEKVKHYTFLIKKNIQENGGNVDTSTLAQSCYYRISQPGQGYKSPFLRKDLSIQVAGMMPAQVFSLGDTNGEQLRLGLYGQPIRLTYKKDGVNHSLSSAKTGSGKDVEKQATLWETYPLGTNWLGIEIGNSYEWSVNSLNKDSSSYHIIDPEHTVINPFPLYSESNAFSDSPLDSHITEGTIRALSFILLDDPNVGKIDFQMAQIDQAAAETTLQMLYAVPKPDQPAPIFEDYYNMLSRP
ncbi:MAG: hypothetical protein OEZ01_08225, partial [Candidatus Heimdallarchaeota archaeon]|nr:hypothetical protein [Candidatus Heimdallarchaeota archaeon]